MIRNIFLLLLFFIVSGCAFTLTKKEINKLEKTQNIDTKASFYLMYPQDGDEYTFFTDQLQKSIDSGTSVEKVFAEKLSPKVGFLRLGSKDETLEDALKKAKLQGDKYLINIDIKEWHNASYLTCNTSGNRESMRDKLDIIIKVYNTQTGEILNKQELKNSGCNMVLLNYIPISKSSPDSRLNSMLEAWFNNLNN
ncbi:DUF4823 domain-containing protein [Rickettsiales bacterium LUAb2]